MLDAGHLGPETLRALVVCRLPFPVPTDPVTNARAGLYQERCPGYMLPTAILRFRQGCGRLIRSPLSKGAIIILDRRIQTATYGHRFVDSLPEGYRMESSIESVGQLALDWINRQMEQ